MARSTVKRAATKATGAKKTAATQTGAKKAGSTNAVETKATPTKTTPTQTTQAAPTGRLINIRPLPPLPLPVAKPADDVSVSADGARLLIRQERKVFLLDATSGKKIAGADLSEPDTVIRCATLLPDGDSFAFQTREQWDHSGASEVRLRSLRAGPVTMLAAFKKAPESFQISTDTAGETLVACSREGAHAYSLPRRSLLRKFAKSGVTAVSPDGQLIVASFPGKNGLVGFGGGGFTKKVATYAGAFTRAEAIAMDAAARYVAAVVWIAGHPAIAAWDRRSGASIAKGRFKMFEPHRLALHPSGELLAAGACSSPGSLVVFRTETGEEVFKRQVKQSTSAIAFSPDGKTLFVAASEPKLLRFSIG